MEPTFIGSGLDAMSLIPSNTINLNKSVKGLAKKAEDLFKKQTPPPSPQGDVFEIKGAKLMKGFATGDN